MARTDYSVLFIVASTKKNEERNCIMLYTTENFSLLFSSHRELIARHIHLKSNEGNEKFKIGAGWEGGVTKIGHYLRMDAIY